MTKYEIAVRLLAEYCDCPSKDGVAIDLPMEWCENHCKYNGENENHVEMLQCWEKVISDRYEAQGEEDKKESCEDVISRQAAIDVIEAGRLTKLIDAETAVNGLKALPSAQPERLTDDDFETIRIHLSAHKERLCNQHRWKEAEEYQRIIDRLMGFASAQPERQWIPVTERLPEDRTRVLVTIYTKSNGYKIRTSYYSHGYFSNDNGDCWKVGDVPLLAWMPMPEPYTEEKKK